MIETNNCIVGGEDHLLKYLNDSFKKAKSVDIIVSFLMESGVKLLKEELEGLLERNIPLRILTGNYLNITQPSALYLLKDIMKGNVDLRFYNVKNKSFHPKANIITYEDHGEIFIGSSNMSASALTTGIEWNYRLDSRREEKDFDCFKSNFEDLFLNHSIIINDEELRRYSKQWKRPKFNPSTEKESNEDTVPQVLNLYEPRGAQIEALYELENTREEGFDKGLVVAATGIGKTYLSAFDSKNFERVLFIAHREEILTQAKESFQNIRPNSSSGYFYGDTKDTDKDIVFATVQTLGKEKYLNDEYFKEDDFEYIVVDEFHHAVANTYKKIIDYFKPEFMLGLTATPERLDNKDVFSLCDYNTVYEIRLAEAINKGLLVPFRYYGVYDESVDYKEIEFKNGSYDKKELEQALMIHKRGELILNHYRKYNSKRALGFCSSKKHAEYMAEFFNQNGIKSCSVISGPSNETTVERKDAINRLKKGDIKVIFSVDMFNEGVDIPSLDMVMMLRPTESSTVFLQQLGRGLRKYKGKKYLNVLDFIGNFKNANMIPFLLTGTSVSDNTGGKSIRIIKEEDFPEDCRVDFDFRLIDLFEQMEDEKKKIEQIILEEYFRIKEYTKRRPNRSDILKYMDKNIFMSMVKNTKVNILNDYLSFLKNNGELNDGEKKITDTFAHEFIQMIENTKMSQLYKMPLLLAFYNDGDMKLEINENDIYESFKDFYLQGSNQADLNRNKSTKDFMSFEKRDYLKLAENPKKAFLKTHKDFFYEKNNLYCLNDELVNFREDKAFLDNLKDVIEYRTMRFYKERLDKKNEEI